MQTGKRLPVTIEDLYFQPLQKRTVSEELICKEGWNDIKDIEEEEEKTTLVDLNNNENENNNDYQSNVLNLGHYKVFGDSIFIDQEEKEKLVDIWVNDYRKEEFLDSDGLYFPSLH